MKMIRRIIKRSLFHTARYTGLYSLAGSRYGGVGVIFNLHRVAAPDRPILYPGHMISAELLDRLLSSVRRMGWEIVSIDEVHQRLMTGRSGRRFASFAFDDGYADNLTIALPIFRKHEAPFSVYLTVGILERSMDYWWGALEEVVLRSDRIDLPENPVTERRSLATKTIEEKQAALMALNELCHQQGERFLPILREMFRRRRIDPGALLDRDALTLDQARRLAADPLVTLGAHTVSHCRLSEQTESEARFEIEEGRRRLEHAFEREVHHLAYPYGGADACGPREFALARAAGYRTAVTTRWGNLFPEHGRHCESLPRRQVPLNDFTLMNRLYGVETLLRRQPLIQTT